MTIKSIWLRRIHKWVGLVIGLQVLVWAISGAAMALLDMSEVAGGPAAGQAASTPMPQGNAWPVARQTLADQRVAGLRTRSMAGHHVLEVTTNGGVRLFDAVSGSPLTIDASLAASIAKAAHPRGLAAANVVQLAEVTLPVREHQLPIWQVDFADEERSSYYVSGTTGELLERRNDSWRWWDFFWMLHNMDYAKRTSFNHPLIIMVGFAMAWLALTGFWLLFRTMWRHDFAFARRRA